MFQTDELPIVNLPDVAQDGKKAMSALEGLSFDDAISKLANSIVDFGFKLMIAIVVAYLGKLVIKKIYKVVRRLMINRNVDASLTTFVLSLIKMILYFILIITVIGIIGIETSSFLALFASAGVAIGMALSGTLQNFAGGVLILLLKPYKVGDYIEAQGYSGTVKSIQIFYTVINTVDNKAIIIPNGGLSTSSVNNYSYENYRRVDWTIGLSYGIDALAAKKKIMEILMSDDRVVKTTFEEDIERHKETEQSPEAEETSAMSEPEEKAGWWKRLRMRTRRRHAEIEQKLEAKAHMQESSFVKVSHEPFVGIGELGDNSVNFTVRAWTASVNYWPLYFTMNERFYTELPKYGFDFPFPQLDVHFDKERKEMLQVTEK